VNICPLNLKQRAWEGCTSWGGGGGGNRRASEKVILAVLKMLADVNNMNLPTFALRLFSLPSEKW
jgi:hypothetical protein